MNFIIEEIKKGNQKVYKNFFDKNYKDLVRYAQGFLFDQQASEDIVQDVFVYIWENAHKINIKTGLINYTHTMVRNRCLNYLKSIKITDQIELLDFNQFLISEIILDQTSQDEQKIIHHQIFKVIEILPDQMQQVVRLKYINEYKYKEIAEELNISVNTVKTHLKRAKIKINESIMVLLVLLGII